MSDREPTISVIVPCSPFEHQVGDFLEHLSRTQKIGEIELLLLAWEGCNYVPLVRGDYVSVEQISFPRTIPLVQVLVQAVRKARAEIVVLAEDHVHYQGPLLDELGRCFQNPVCGAVGWMMMPMDRNSLTSLAGYLASYGLWGPGVNGGFVDSIAAGNCTYRRSALLECGDKLELLIGARTVLNERLKKNGFKLYISPEIISHHASLPTMTEHIRSDFWYGWSFAATRQHIEGWSIMKRLAYTVGIYLKPLVRWWLLLNSRLDLRAFPPGTLLKAAPMISLAFVVASLGESCGHFFGHSNSLVKFTEYEIGIKRIRSHQ